MSTLYCSTILSRRFCGLYYVRLLMRLFNMFAASFFCSAATAGPIPDLVCRVVREVTINPKTLETQVYDTSTIYRFRSGKLYLTPSDRAEYLYNEVVESELMRYMSGHKVIQFESGDTEFRAATFVHTYLPEVRVSKASCKRL